MNMTQVKEQIKILPSKQAERERVACPLCRATASKLWATENGYQAVKCTECGLIYVNPRPSADSIDRAVQAGAHTEESLNLDVTARRTPGNVAHYKRIVGRLFADVMAKDQPISWLDVGAGYGEVVEAVTQIAPRGSRVSGIEPVGSPGTELEFAL